VAAFHFPSGFCVIVKRELANESTSKERANHLPIRAPQEYPTVERLKQRLEVIVRGFE
jgi:hypothetical protein